MSNEPTGVVGPDGSLPPQAPYLPRPGSPGPLVPAGTPPVPADGPQVPDRGFGTGAFIRLHLQTATQNFRPAWTIDGFTQLTEWGTHVIPVAPGRHRVGGGLAVTTRASASVEVDVAVGQMLDVYYATGTGGGTGRVGLQPVKTGLGPGWLALLILGVTLLVLVVVIFLVFVIATLD